MDEQFEVIQVTEENYATLEDEQMGSKTKFWFDHQKLGRCLYKQARLNTGEDWAEKIAAELCNLLGLPHACYELAKTWEGNYGVVSPNFVREEETLVHGNEILAAIIPNYPRTATYNATQHTIDIVLTSIAQSQVNLPPDWTPPSTIETAVELFVGYLLLDTWIGNGDRHHENWGFIRRERASTSETIIYLAPTYDHASSLGRELSDRKRQNRQIETYINNCSSAFYIRPLAKVATK
jgi:hypothetical protein